MSEQVVFSQLSRKFTIIERCDACRGAAGCSLSSSAIGHHRGYRLVLGGRAHLPMG